MTGLFHRLARQMVGPEPTRVHAMSRLPFVSPPGPDVATEPRVDTATMPASPRATGPAPATGTARATSAEPVSAPIPTATNLGTSTPAPHVAPMSASAHTEPTPAHAAPETPAATPVVNHATPPLVANGPAPTPRTTGPATPGQPRAYATADEVPTLLAPEHSPDIDVPPPLVAAPVEAPDRPGALGARPSAPAQARTPGAGTTRPASPSAAAPAAEPTEVHVHIGRIEVTAVPEAAPARSKTPAGPPPMSLEEYLARRERGGP